MRWLEGIGNLTSSDYWGVAKLVKAPDFDSGIRGFESFLPSQKLKRVSVLHAFIFSKGNPLWPMAT
jgi:hypothetical protein